MRLIIPAVWTICLGLAFPSCIREGLPECPAGSTLKVILSPRQTDITISAGDLQRAVVYVFDEGGDVFAVWTVGEPVFDTTYDTGIILGPDTYRLVTWINPDAPYSLIPAYGRAVGSGVKMTDASLSLSIPEDGYVTKTLPWLLFGCVESVRMEDTADTVEVPVQLNSYVINLKVTGLLRDQSNYTFLIRDNNCIHDFYNNYMLGDPFYYKTAMTFSSPTRAEEDVLTASLTILRLDNGRSPEIDFVDSSTGRSLYPASKEYTANLIELIGQSCPGNDFDTTHEYDIQMDFSDDMSVRIYVNGWELKEDVYQVE